MFDVSAVGVGSALLMPTRPSATSFNSPRYRQSFVGTLPGGPFGTRVLIPAGSLSP